MIFQSALLNFFERKVSNTVSSTVVNPRVLQWLSKNSCREFNVHDKECDFRVHRQFENQKHGGL